MFEVLVLSQEEPRAEKCYLLRPVAVPDLPPPPPPAKGEMELRRLV